MVQYDGCEVLGRKEDQWSGNSEAKKEVTYCSYVGHRTKTSDFRGLEMRQAPMGGGR